MRTALLAALKRTETGDIRAFLPLAGRSLLAWQFDLVLALGCERVICLCDAPGTEILDIQHEAETAGVQFHAIKGPLQLVGLITADQDLVMMLDGLVMEPDGAASLNQQGRMIATIPASSSLAQEHAGDFERIDAGRAWAGLAIVPGRLAEKLADLPGDGETMSMLLRLALQAGEKSVSVDAESLNGGGLLLATDAEGLQKRQIALIERSAQSVPWTGPSQAGAALLAAKTAPAGLERGPRISATIGIASMVTMVGTTWLDHSVGGLFAGAFGALALAFSDAGTRLKSALYGFVEGTKQSSFINSLRDILIAFALCLGMYSGMETAGPILVLPLLAIGLLHLASATQSAHWRAFWSDRALQLAALGICAIFGQLTAGIAVLALGALAHALLRLQKAETTRE